MALIGLSAAAAAPPGPLSAPAVLAGYHRNVFWLAGRLLLCSLVSCIG